MQRIVWDRGARPAAGRGRGRVGVADLDAEALVLGIAQRCNIFRSITARSFTIGAVGIQVRRASIDRSDVGAHPAVALRGLAIAQADRSAFGTVECEQA